MTASWKRFFFKVSIWKKCSIEPLTWMWEESGVSQSEQSRPLRHNSRPACSHWSKYIQSCLLVRKDSGPLIGRNRFPGFFTSQNRFRGFLGQNSSVRGSVIQNWDPDSDLGGKLITDPQRCGLLPMIVVVSVVIRNDFFSDPHADPTFQLVSDSDPDPVSNPTWIIFDILNRNFIFVFPSCKCVSLHIIWDTSILGNFLYKKEFIFFNWAFWLRSCQIL
jgi:hypothetical protein